MDTHSDLPRQMSSGGGIGALLRASRLRRGEELEDIAAVLRIRRVYIEAIEEDRFDDLPGHAYAVGFVRGYAEYLDLDGEDVVRRFKEDSSVPDQPAELSFPSFIPQHGMPRGAILMVGVLVAALGYGGWYFLSTQDRFVAEVVTPVPSRLQPEAVQETAPAAAANAASVQPVADAPSAAPEPVETPAVAASAPEAAVEPSAEPAPPEVTEAAETPAPAAVETDAAASETAPAANPEAVETAPADATEPRPAAETVEAGAEPAAETVQAGAAAAPEPPAMPDTPQASGPAPEPDPTQVALNDTGQPAAEPAEPAETQIAAVQPAADDETPASAATEEEPRIVVRAKISSWVQVRDDTENQSIMTRLLKAGDVYEVPNRPGLVLMTGNAGALEITVDGEVVPSIGDAGTVRRHVALEPDRLKDGTAVVE